MTITRKLIVLLAMLLVAPVVMAEQPALKSLLERLNSVEAMSGTFVQVMRDPQGELVQETDGEFKILRPGYFFWKTNPPYEQWLVGNPATLSVYDPDLEQVTIYQADQLRNSPASILSGEESSLSEKFCVAIAEQNDASVSYQLRYKDGDKADFDSLEVQFVDGQLSSLKLTDKLQQITHVNFTHIDTGAELDKSMFEFQPPTGTDVIVQ